MFGVYKNNDATWCRWCQAWFDILDYLFSILTFSYAYMDIAGWLFHGEQNIFGKSYISATSCRRLNWSLRYFINILEELFLILTLGYLIPNWEQYVVREGEKA